MRRIAGLAGGLVLALAVLVPVALAADPSLPHTGRVLVSVGGDITLPAGEHADVVVVVRGTATILGEVNTIVTVDGRAILTGARAETLVAVSSPVTLSSGTVVSGDIFTMDAPVSREGDAFVGGDVRNLAGELVGLGFILGPVIVLWMLGVALAAIAAGLLLAALASRQVRTAETLISREPAMTIAAGLIGILLPLVIAVPAIVTIVGAPLGLGILLFLWPLTAFLGYLVAAIWIGDWLLARMTPGVTRERPYAAAVVGVVVLEVSAVFPPLLMIAVFMGYGAVLLLAWRTFRAGHGAMGVPSLGQATPAAPTPVAG